MAKGSKGGSGGRCVPQIKAGTGKVPASKRTGKY
jgi:hypothetical protein